MGLDVMLTVVQPVDVFWKHISHNSRTIAIDAGLYYLLWKPDELGYNKAYELIEGLEHGLGRLEFNRSNKKHRDPEMDFIHYDSLVTFVEEYLEACRGNPDADVTVSR